MLKRKPCLKYFNYCLKLTRTVGRWGEDCSLSLPFARGGRRGRGYYAYLIRNGCLRNCKIIALDFFSCNIIEYNIRGVNGLIGGN